MFALSHNDFGLKPFAVADLKASPGFWFLVVGAVTAAIMLLAQL